MKTTTKCQACARSVGYYSIPSRPFRCLYSPFLSPTCIRTAQLPAEQALLLEAAQAHSYPEGSANAALIGTEAEHRAAGARPGWNLRRGSRTPGA